MNEYPEELRNPVVPVVAMVGHPATHPIIEKNILTKTIYDVNTPIFKLVSLESGMSVPSKKDKRPNYDSYFPNGIIKANWMHKHKSVLPAVIALMCSWDGGAGWKENETEICTQLASIQQGAKPRNIKIVVVLYHTLPNEPSPNDEKFVSLRKRTDLDAKNFLFIPKNDLKNHVKRFEKVVQEFANTYYTEAARRIKNMRAHVNPKTAQIALFIRLQFKLGYYAEFRPDKFRAALKHYTAGYNNLKEMKMMDQFRSDHIRMTEIKIVASYFNYKMCMLFFALGNATEAVQQFQRHTRLYKSAQNLPQPDREYEHWAWVAREYQVFGELLNIFHQHALHTKGIYHPGYYFGAAAKYAMDRKKAAKKYVEPQRAKYQATTPPKPASIDLKNMVYVGQPPVSLSHPLEQFSESFTPDAGEDHTRSISQELAVDHSAIIIDLLTKTWHHYKAVRDEHKNVIYPKSPRTILYIASQMAQENFQSGQWARAKKFYDKIAKSYRREEWYSLLTHSLECALQCAQKLGNVQAYLKHSLDLITTRTTNSKQAKVKIQSDIINILENPEPPLKLEAPLEIKLDDYKGLLNVKVQFTKDTAFANQQFLFLVRISTKFPSPVKFSEIQIAFNDTSYSTKIENESQFNSYYETKQTNLKPVEPTGIVLESEKPRIFEVPLIGKQKADLACVSVTLVLGTGYSAIHLKKTIQPVEKEQKEGERGWEAEKSLVAHAQATGASAAHLRRDVSFSHIMRMDAKQLGHNRKKFLEKATIEVLDSEPKIDITLIHAPPALINEYYKVELVMTNHDDDVTWGTLSWDVSGGQGDSSIYSTRTNKASPVSQVPVGKIKSGATFRQFVYIFSSSADEKTLSVHLNYETANHKTNTTKTTTFPVQTGFTVRYQVFTETLQQLQTTTDTLHAHEPLLLLAEINPLPSYPLILYKTELVMNSLDGSAPVAKMLSSTSSSNALVVTRHNRFAAWFKVQPTVCGEFSLGQLVVYWKRHDLEDTDAPFTVTKTPLPLVKVTRPYFSVTVDSAAAGVVGQPIPHTITITNHTTLPQEFTLLIVPHQPPPQPLSTSSLPSASSPTPPISTFGAPLANPLTGKGSQIGRGPTPSVSLPTPGISDVFLISGDRQTSFSIHPHSTHVIKHNLLPIVAGNHLRPHFQIISKRLLKELSQTKYDERYIFVRPSLTTSPN